MSTNIPPPPGGDYPPAPPPPPPPPGSDETLPPRGLGEILSAAWDIYMKNAAQLITIVAIVVVPLELISFLVSRVALGAKKHTAEVFGRTITVTETRSFFVVLLGLLVAAAIGIIISAILQAALFRGAAQATIGDPVDVRTSYQWGLKRFGSVLLVSFLVAVTVVIGFVLLIIPGFLFLGMFAVSVPVVVVEGARGTDAMRRSWELVKGHFWHVLGVVVVTAIITGLVSSLIGAIGGRTIVGLIFDLIARIITAPFTALVTVLLYLDVRARAEMLTKSRLRQELGSGA
jgi:hypothetical protein